MKKLFVLLTALFTLTQVNAQEKNVIRIATDNTDLILQVAPNGRLYQAYLGDKLLNEKDINNFSPYVKGGSDGSVSTRGWEVYPGSGAEDYFEPAVAITHNDGNPSTILRYVSSEQKAVAGGTETVIQLKDDQYPVEVTLHYIAYPKENVIKTWSEIKHAEKKPVTIWRYASTMLYFSGNEYYLTEFSSDWAKEAQMSTQPLLFGKKVIDTKLGSRAAMHTHPFFELGFEQPAQETQGRAMLGTIGWTGNFQFTFEVDNVGNLRVIPAINPYASDYELKPNEVFTTPEFIFTFSNNGTGEASRNLHAWARNYQLKDGQGDRMTLLNNWENTYFKFDEKLLAELMKEAKHLGVDMFLLDDGWFGNKHPRNSDNAGLGDWEVMKSKLPGGIPALVKSAKEAGVKFGIWIEPEMVNADSDLFRTHPDWILQVPGRTPCHGRYQYVLDFSRQEILDYIYEKIASILEGASISYIKWDMNRSLSDVWSRGVSARQQGEVFHRYILGVYQMYERLTTRFPDILFESCASGGARFDAGMLYYAPQGWISDDTDAIERLRIQYGTSYGYPISSMGSHVSASPNHQLHRQTPLWTRANTAFFGTFGYELDLMKMSEEDKKTAREQILKYKEIEHLVQSGDYYRLINPFENNNHVLWQFVSKDKKETVVCGVRLHSEANPYIYLFYPQGLDADLHYEDIATGKVYTGAALMKAGLPLPLTTGDYQPIRFTFKAVEK